MTWRRAVRAALPAALVATFFSIVVTFLLYAASGYDWGADVSQRLMARVAEAGALGTDPSPTRRAALSGARPVRWALVDLGPRVCAPPGPGIKPICPPLTSHTDLGALAATIRWVSAARPKLVVVDVAAVGSLQDADAFDAKLAGVQAPVLMALQTNPRTWIGRPIPTVAPESVAAQLAGRTGRPVRYFYPMIRPANPVTRTLLPVLAIAGQGKDVLAPTLSYAAAMQLGVAPGCEARGTLPSPCLSDFALTPRVFSFRPVAPADSADWDGSLRSSSDGFLYLYLPAPRAEDAAPPSPELAGGVVIIGDTRRETRDRFWTAIGELSGAEIQLNDIRQFTLAEPSPAPGIGGVLLGDFPYMLIGLGIVWLVQGFALRFPPSRKGSPARRKWRKLGRVVAVTAATSLMSAIAFAFWQTLFSARGAPPDFVTPLVGIALGNGLETAAQIASWIEHRVKPHTPRKGEKR